MLCRDAGAFDTVYAGARVTKTCGPCAEGLTCSACRAVRHA